MAEINPLTGDFTRTPRGDFIAGTTVMQEVVLRLTTERGSLLWDVTFGSMLHDLVRRRMGAGIEEVSIDMAKDALQPMIDAGRLTELEVAAEKVTRTRLHMSIRGRNAAGQPVSLSQFVAI